MTIEEAKRKLVNWCNSQIGYREGTGNWNKYADLADIRKMYGWNPQNQPWCDVFADAAFICCFGYDLASAMTFQFTGKGSALCRTSASYYKQYGAWYTTPAVGDQAFFYVDGDINHTGIVTSVGMGAITTVEGNSSDMVSRRTYDANSPAIAGFGRPKWSLVEGNSPDVPNDEPEEELPEPVRPDRMYHRYQYSVKINLLKQGDFGPQVFNVKAMLRAHGYDCSDNDEFDDSTVDAFKAFQTDQGIEPDGELGGETFTRLYNYGGQKDATEQ